MPKYLEMTADKFTFRVATDRLYSPEGVWVLPQPDSTRVRVGLADYLQQHNGDVAFANVKPVGTKLAAGGQFAEIETIKAMVDLHAPISGTIVEVNAALNMSPESHQPGTLRSGLAGGDRTGGLGGGAVQAARSGGILRGDASAGAGGFEGPMKPGGETVVVVPCSGIGKPFGTREPGGGLRFVRGAAAREHPAGGPGQAGVGGAWRSRAGGQASGGDD